MSEEYQKITIPEYVEYQSLKKKLDCAVKALEFYAQAGTWGVAGSECVSVDPSDWQTYPFSEYSTSNEFRGGKRARLALGEIKK